MGGVEGRMYLCYSLSALLFLPMSLQEGSNTLILTRKISVHTPGVDALKRETHRLKVEEGDVDMYVLSSLCCVRECFTLLLCLTSLHLSPLGGWIC